MESNRTRAACFLFSLSLAAIGPVQAALPAPPTIAVGAADGAATVTWPPAAGASDYVLYWGTSANISAAKAFTMSVPGVTSPFTQTQLSNGTAYYFVLTSINRDGESPGSNVATTTPAPACPSTRAIGAQLDRLLAAYAGLTAPGEAARRQQMRADIVAHSEQLLTASARCK